MGVLEKSRATEGREGLAARDAPPSIFPDDEDTSSALRR